MMATLSLMKLPENNFIICLIINKKHGLLYNSIYKNKFVKIKVIPEYSKLIEMYLYLIFDLLINNNSMSLRKL